MFGNVVSADWNADKTTGDWAFILEQTIHVVKATKFNRLPYNTDYNVNHYTSDDYLLNRETECQEGSVEVKFLVVGKN